VFLRYLTRRLLRMALVVFGAVSIVFLIMHLTPGDPTLLLLPENPPPEVAARLRAAWGLDQPIHVQYLVFLGRAFRGDLGMSIYHSAPAVQVALERIPATVQLTFFGVMFSLAVAVPLGVLAATHQNSLLDYLSRVIALLGQSMPAFWLGLMLMLFFGVYLGVLPVSGRGEPTGFVLPTVTLGAYLLAIVMRLTRSEMLGVLREDFVRTARSKGLAERAVIYGHALKNVLIPLITVVGLQFGTLLGGAVVTETIFAWPGVGRLIMDSVLAKDYPVVQASILIVTILLVTVNLITDLIYGYVDPRVRLG